MVGSKPGAPETKQGRTSHDRDQPQALKAAAADGNTLFLSHDHTISILPLVTKGAGFDPAQDFAPVAGFATFVNAFAVSGGTPAKTFAGYVKWVQDGGDKAGGNSASCACWWCWARSGKPCCPTCPSATSWASAASRMCPTTACSRPGA